jgi:hypothetical protein
MPFDRSQIRPVSIEEIQSSSLTFLVDEVLPKLDHLRLFEDAGAFSASRLENLGPVLLTKCVLMPVRLLYVLLPSSHERPYVSPEEACEVCAESYSGRDWWDLVAAARRWRDVPPTGLSAFAEASRLLTTSVRGLYDHCLKEYQTTAQVLGDDDAQRKLESWINRVGSAP